MERANTFLISAILFLTLANAGSVLAEGLPGNFDGTGTHFEITDSPHFNFSLDSNESIKIMIQAMPKTIFANIESISEASSTGITVSGFTPLTTYYKYEDSFHNLTEFTTDEFGSYTYIQDLSETHLVIIQSYPSTLFINDDSTGGDCTSIGTWDASSKTCAITTDVIDTIEIESDGITLDGGGQIFSTYIFANGKEELTIINVDTGDVHPGHDEIGLYIFNSSNITIEYNKFSNRWSALYLRNFNNSTIRGNTFNSNIIAIAPGLFNNNTIVNNNFIDNETHIHFWGDQAGNTFNLDAPVGGNYWSDHNNTDADEDGFADTVYFFTGGHDNLPLAKPFVQEEEAQDEVPPVTTIALSGTGDSNSWYVSDVEVTLTATDEGGTVASTEYSFDEADWNAYTAPFSISEEGTAAIYFRSTDDSGNVEETKSQIVKIDKTAPEITYTKTPEPNTNGWNNSDVTIQFTCTDNTSGITECTPDTTTITTEGTAQTTTGTATDQAGNTTTITTEEINIDKTAPSIGIAKPQSNGIYTVGTALDFSAEDLVSGIAGTAGELTNTNGEILSVESGFAPEPGVYTLIVRAEDSAGNLAESNPVPFVVYDPKGGFATGGGWFHPDAESNLPEEGKANFGFVTSYKKGNSTGKLLFHYKVNPQCEKAGKCKDKPECKKNQECKDKCEDKPACKETNLTLNSKTIDWLVISGTSAEFQGTGTINGTGLYTFRATIKDHGKPRANTDSFDITIWKGTNTEAEPLYKAKNNLEGGNIVIHKK